MTPERDPSRKPMVGDVFRLGERLLRLMGKDTRRRGNLAFRTTIFTAEDDRGIMSYYGLGRGTWPPSGAEFVGKESKAKWEKRFAAVGKDTP